MGKHAKKEIPLAIEYALEHGWRLHKAGPRAHIWGTLLCRRATAADGMYIQRREMRKIMPS